MTHSRGSLVYAGATTSSQVKCIDGVASILVAPPPGGPSPDAPPGPGALYSVAVTVEVRLIRTVVAGLNVTCPETGVTQVSTCGSMLFYFNQAGTYTIETPGGTGLECGGGSALFGASSTSVTIPSSGGITLFVISNQ